MCEERYEGWANRETWAVALWINNDQGMQESAIDAVREARGADPDPLGMTRGMIDRAGSVVREYVEDLFDWSNYGEEHGGQVCVPAVRLNMLEDIGSLYRVDWHEIGASFLADVMS